MALNREQLTAFLYFIALGLLSSMWQMTFLREVLISFRGNEFYLNYFLICWLVLAGLGSLLQLKFIREGKKNLFIHYFFYFISVLSIVVFLLVNLLPRWLNFTTQIPNLFILFLALPIILSLFCLLLGLGFSWGANYWQTLFPNQTVSRSVNLFYLWEMAGWLAGSLSFNFFFIKLTAFELLIIIFIFAFYISLFILFKKIKSLALIIFLVALTIAGLFLTDKWSLSIANWRWPGQKLIASINTDYGNIAVTEEKEQINFYANGSLIFPTTNLLASEELIHLPLARANSSGKILILGYGSYDLIKTSLEYPYLEIYYLEPDPTFLVTIKSYLPPEYQTILKDNRVKTISADPMLFLRNNQELFDNIIINLPAPATYQINRYWTKEFFALLTNNLTNEGQLAIAASYEENDLNNPLWLNLYKSILIPLEQIFPQTQLIAGEKLIILASKQVRPITSASILNNFTNQKLKTTFFSQEHLNYLLTTKKSFALTASLKKTSALTNANESPIGLVYELIKQTEINSPVLAHFLNEIIIYRYLILLIIFILPWLLVFYYKLKWKDEWSAAKIKLLAVLASGLSIIWEIIIIFTWQNFYGNIFREVSLLIGLIMLGVFFANLQFYLKPNQLKEKNLFVYLLLLVFLTLIALVWSKIFPGLSVLLDKAGLLALSVLSGYLAGAIYPLINFLYLNKKPATERKAGKIYGLELIGSALLLIIFSFFILPIFGMTVSLLSLLYLFALNLLILKFD